MLIGFTGEHECKLDSKGRVMLPSKLRGKLPDLSQRVMYLRKGFEDNLTLYPASTFEKIVSGFDGLDEFDETHRVFERNFMRGVQEIELDDNFRFLIPKSLIQLLDLKKNITLVGVRDRIEIWDSSRWAEEQIKDSAAFSRLSEKVMAGVKKGDKKDIK